MPRVSIIMPSYNHENYVAAAINSVLDQTYEDFELIITDDASSDDTAEVIRGILDPRIRFFAFDENKGAVNAVANCLHYALGEYISIISSDDVYLPNKLQKQITILDENLDIGAVFSRAQIIDELGEPFGDQVHFYSTIFDQPNRSRHEWLRHFFLNGNCLCHTSILARRECYTEIWLPDPRLVQLPDFDIWIRLCFQREIYVMQETLVQFRVFATNANASGITPEKTKRTWYEYYHILFNYLFIQSLDELVDIFPDAKLPNTPKLTEDQKDVVIKYNLALQALSAKTRFHELFALNLIFDVMSTPSRSRNMQELYNFTYKDLYKLTGDSDPFDIRGESQKSDRPIICSLFIDTGDGFTEKQMQTHEPKELNSAIEFNLESYRGVVQGLRFVPHYTGCEVRISCIMILDENDQPHEVSYSSNCSEKDGNTLLFTTCDPHIILNLLPNIQIKSIKIVIEYIKYGISFYEKWFTTHRDKYYAQLYIDDGNGFSEDKSVLVPVGPGWNTLSFNIGKYLNIKGLRFDPLNDRAALTIKNTFFVNTDGTHIPAKFTWCNGRYLNNALIFNTPDPNIIIAPPICSGQKYLLIEVNFLARSKDVFDYETTQL